MTSSLPERPVIEQRGLYFDELEVGAVYAPRPGQGVVSMAHTGRNQHGDIVATATRSVLMWSSTARQSVPS